MGNELFDGSLKARYYNLLLSEQYQVSKGDSLAVLDLIDCESEAVLKHTVHIIERMRVKDGYILDCRVLDDGLPLRVEIIMYDNFPTKSWAKIYFDTSRRQKAYVEQVV